MTKRVIILILILCSVVWAENPYRIFNSFNSGELSPLLSSREDLLKYQSGCSIMENMIPYPQGGATKRPGTKYIAEVKTSSLATRLLPFEFSTSQSYVIEAGKQYFRFFTDASAILEGGGTETLTAVDGGNLVAHWLLNDDEGLTVVNDDNPGTLDGTVSVDTGTLHATGKVGTGCFDLSGQYNVYMADDAALSFTDNTDDEPFSLVCWAYIIQQSEIQNLISKWDETSGAPAMEYRLSLNSERKLQLHLGDTNIDLSADMIAQWYLNDTAGNTHCDDVSTNHDGVIADSVLASTLTATGKTAMTPCFDFDSQYAVEVPDADTLSFGNSSVDSPFSIAAWIFATGASGNEMILSKYDRTSGTPLREWQIYLLNSKLKFRLIDHNVLANINVVANDILTTGWHFVVGTYDATEADTGLNLYIDGAVLGDSDVTRSTDGSYVAMENTAAEVIIGARTDSGGSLGSFFQDKIDNVILFDAEITQATVSALYNDGDGRELLTSAATEILATADDPIDLGWHFLVSTYDATDNGSATAANGIILYVDGVAVGSTVINDPSYGAMQDGGGLFRIGAQESIGGAAEKFWADKIDEVSLFKDVLTPTEVASLYTTTPYEIETPYLTADLFDLKYEQSADVLFITHPDYETRKLSRLVNTLWTVTAIGIDDGPFRTQNDDVADFITASATTGSVTLTATGHAPFISGTTAGHEPSGSAATSKSQTGALYKLVHPLDTLEYKDTLEDDYTANQTEGVSWMHCGTLYEGTEWTWTTGGTWLGTVEVQRNYTIGAAHGASGWETVLPYSGITTARNITTTGTEDDGDADYRVIFTDDTSGTVISYFSTDQTEHIGIVEITSVTSSTEAIGTVIKTLASTDATHKWAEGSWSNYRGWPQTVTFFEDRLMFGGNTSQPDTIWGSVTGDYENMEAGADDDDALLFTLSSRQVNVIEWLIGKDKLLIGTSGAEWTLEGGADEPLTPSNVIAKQHSTYGSANLQATLANESVLFFQRGKEKMRELAYNWELDSYVAPDMTILAGLVTDSGIDDTAFQKIPDSILWCVRNDGELPVFSYERKENITAWSRMITTDANADSDFESVARISGSPEDEIWVIVERTIDSNVVRYIEQFQPRDFGSDPCDAYYVDCGATYTTDVNIISDLIWLEGESVIALADGVIITDLVVSSNSVTLGGVYQKVQIGLPYTVQLRTMPLSWVAKGVTIQGMVKRISEVIAQWYISGDFFLGRDVNNKGLYSLDGQSTGIDRITFPAGYDRNGYVYIWQKSPEPLTILSVAIEFDVN